MDFDGGLIDSVRLGSDVKAQSFTSVPAVDRLPAKVLPEQTQTAVSRGESALNVRLILTSVQEIKAAV